MNIHIALYLHTIVSGGMCVYTQTYMCVCMCADMYKYKEHAVFKIQFRGIFLIVDCT